MTQSQLDLLPPDARRELLLRRAEPAPLRLVVPTVQAHRRGPPSVVAALAGSLVLLVVAVVHARGMYTAPLRFDDEGTYVSQAQSLLHGELAPYTYWYDHPPLGWIILSGWLAGPGALWHAPNLIGSGRQLMVLTDLASVGLLVVLARRLGLSLWAGCAAALLFALSPLALTFHRMVLLDNIATPLLLLAFVCTLSPRQRLSAAFVAGFALAAAVLVKETTALMAPFVLWTLWRSVAGPTRRMCVTVFLCGLALPVLVYPLYAVTKGELVPGTGHVSLLQGVAFQLFERRSSGSVLDPSSDAHSVVVDWLARDPYLVTVAAALAVPALLSRRLRPLAAALVFGLVAMLRPGYLPVPYVVALLPLAALVVAGCGDLAVRRLASRVRQGRMASGRGRTRRAPLLAPLTAALVLLVSTVAVLAGGDSVAQHWYQQDRSLVRVDFDRPYSASNAWLLAHVPPGKRLLVDNVTWTDLVQQGWPQDRLVWFTKPNTDPEVDRVVRSYRDIDYVVSSDIMRTSRDAGPTLQAALKKSRTVASFGAGTTLVQVRKVLR